MALKVSGILAITFVALCLVAAPAQAVDVLESQEDIVLTLERGTSHEFPLLLQNVDEISTLESAGDIEGWIGFWEDGENEYEIYPGQSYVQIVIDVPDDEDLGEYDGEVRWDGKTLSTISVKVTLELNDVMSYETLSDMDDDVGALQDRVELLTDGIIDLRTQVATLEYNMSEKVEEIYEYQKDLTELEKEKTELERKHEDLSEDYVELEEKYSEVSESNEELNALTGALAGTQVPGMFIGGLLAGVIAMAVIIRREEVKRKVKRKLSNSMDRSKKDEFKYSFGK